MLTLLYRSDAVSLLPFSALADICMRSSVNNRRLDVTGFLMEHEGIFLQVLEGEAETVAGLFARISQDKRHGNLAVLGRRERPGRSFGFWAMNFGPLDDPTFWHGDFSDLRDGEAFRRKSCDAETALALLCHAYVFASKVAVSDPVVGGFVMGYHSASPMTPARKASSATPAAPRRPAIVYEQSSR
ncbi:BLUF domain-containing protein [Azospirillum sp. YIM B02556]|uniref:BLUF domain-containing protein n=1 Tax=Azospirillum endophyticum TaxID=2800326 RepID=A0ABS1FEN4_9PROT|nr:BLUF domain-containing protein [Azospirillum endophyticum]MBK1841906.1 BLUF domain-containing protein [Azospirillum endophyticum]